MKKTITTIFASALLLFTVQAQDSNIFNFKTKGDVDAVLKVFKSELQLDAEHYTELQDLLMKSYNFMDEQYKKGLTEQQLSQGRILIRQYDHIEGNLKNILGEERYKLYQTNNAAIVAKVAEAKKKN